MVLSVIIVNYNVKYFLEQCLCSVKKAMGEWSVVSSENAVEVFVVDNNSSDGSVEYLSSGYSFVTFISNTQNIGFAKANNLALQRATGKYVLFLNPDTIVPGNAFTDCIRFMEEHNDAGGLGVYMADGSGQFLRESKRGFPSAWVSFCKMSGLTDLFPSSKLFARYYLGHLPNTNEHKVDVLSGAFMLVRKETLNKTGGFDEQFFMYAEDIDLSCRIQKAGYSNYYFPGCQIIHFKGESTTKDRQYVLLFYKAMIQFVRKHFHGSAAWLYTLLLKLAIEWKRGKKSEVRSQESEGNTGAFYFTGDEQSITEVKEWLGDKVTIATAEKATAIIFCEGETYSFQQIIQELQRSPNNKRLFIHGKGTYSIVGSHSSIQQGETVVLHQG